LIFSDFQLVNNDSSDLALKIVYTIKKKLLNRIVTIPLCLNDISGCAYSVMLIDDKPYDIYYVLYEDDLFPLVDKSGRLVPIYLVKSKEPEFIYSYKLERHLQKLNSILSDYLGDAVTLLGNISNILPEIQVVTTDLIKCGNLINKPKVDLPTEYELHDTLLSYSNFHTDRDNNNNPILVYDYKYTDSDSYTKFTRLVSASNLVYGYFKFNEEDYDIFPLVYNSDSIKTYILLLHSHSGTETNLSYLTVHEEDEKFNKMMNTILKVTVEYISGFTLPERIFNLIDDMNKTLSGVGSIEALSL
jgi:hypothetical protein